ncbi:hypothetical protein L226DRAFT_349668 [Lentinus tigrinus ALCF2SS1-7]|uniref:uncharacterized protein n=1 Tax=Lentinus tigrinus ALCF2SS1-7 TaxID=1328758 RepID=UPI0011662C84|nr:hypothetical protein L226DRAFT_349668 [Lentinus tigrinus ALCF2SS1-7]
MIRYTRPSGVYHRDHSESIVSRTIASTRSNVARPAQCLFEPRSLGDKVQPRIAKPAPPQSTFAGKGYRCRVESSPEQGVPLSAPAHSRGEACITTCNVDGDNTGGSREGTMSDSRQLQVQYVEPGRGSPPPQSNSNPPAEPSPPTCCLAAAADTDTDTVTAAASTPGSRDLLLLTEGFSHRQGVGCRGGFRPSQHCGLRLRRDDMPGSGGGRRMREARALGAGSVAGRPDSGRRQWHFPCRGGQCL